MPNYLEQRDDYWIVEDDLGYGNALVLRRPWRRGDLKLVRKFEIQITRLNEYVGWNESDLSFLDQLPGLKGIDIISEKVTDVTAVFRLSGLITLSLYCPAKAAGNFSQLKHLRDLGLSWRGVYRSAFKLDKLTRINISEYPNQDLQCWPRNTVLHELRLCSRRLRSLSGIGQFLNIEVLRLFECSALRSLDSISVCSSIMKLSLAKCRGIVDLSPLSNLSELRELAIEDCGRINSLSPLAKCKKLEVLQIAGNTTVEDGEFSSLMRLPHLRRVLLANRKHYSHTAEKLERK